ncbi:MAG TPA: chloride channel protein [Polyangiaceae bacterium]|nr:chloride channel protein [Polyangiaceae bacterium]
MRLSPLGLAVSESLKTAKYLLLVVAPVGAAVGVAIAAYDWIVNELLWNHVARLSLAVQIAAPAVGMCLTGLLLHLFRVRSSSMADEVVSAYHDPEVNMPVEQATGKLAASITTMGLGASAGMEGASKWLGATTALLLQRQFDRLHSLRWSHRTTMLAGGSAGIAAIFRAPLSGAIMGVESPFKHDLAHEALLPALVASAVSFSVFTHFRPATPYFPISFHYGPTARDLLVAVPLGLSAGIASHLFLGTLTRLRDGFTKHVLSIPIRTTIGGLLLSLLAYASYRFVGRPVTLQAGLPVANDLLNGHFVLAACVAIFVLKLAATAITFGSGGVGGLFVPTATIGAALGACWDALVPGSQPGMFTLLGVAAFSGASYNSLLFSAVFIAEATGNVFLVVPALIACGVAFITTAGISNSRAQRERRPDTDDLLAKVPIERIMTRRIVTMAPDQPLRDFSESVLLGHHFRALPVIANDGTFRGMVRVEQLRRVPMTEWGNVLVAHIMDDKANVLCPHHSVADAVRALGNGKHDYVPIVDPLTYRLIGIVSNTDLHRVSVKGSKPYSPLS